MLAQPVICVCTSQPRLQSATPKSHHSLGATAGFSKWLCHCSGVSRGKDGKHNWQKEKALEVESSGNQVKLPRVRFQEPHKKHVITPVTGCGNTCEMLPTRDALSAPSVLTGSWSWRQPLPSTCQNSRLPERKQAASRKHSTCTNSLGVMHGSHQSMVATVPKSKFPEGSQGPALQANLFKDRSLGLLC